MLNIAKMENLIKAKGWSKTFFAAKFGKNKGWVSDMKRGIGVPDENMIQAISDALDTTPEYLTDKSEQKNKPSAGAEGVPERAAIFMKKYDALSPEQKKQAEKMLDFLLADQDKKS